MILIWSILSELRTFQCLSWKLLITWNDVSWESKFSNNINIQRPIEYDPITPIKYQRLLGIYLMHKSNLIDSILLDQNLLSDSQKCFFFFFFLNPGYSLKSTKSFWKLQKIMYAFSNIVDFIKFSWSAFCESLVE